MPSELGMHPSQKEVDKIKNQDAKQEELVVREKIFLSSEQ